MKSAFTHWANLEAARDDSSMNLNYLEVAYLIYPSGEAQACVKSHI